MCTICHRHRKTVQDCMCHIWPLANHSVIGRELPISNEYILYFSKLYSPIDSVVVYAPIDSVVVYAKNIDVSRPVIG